MIEVDRPHDARLLELLRSHPEVRILEPLGESGVLSFRQQAWRREVRFQDASLGGLIELEDNNPMVCADSVAVPSPAATLAWIALGPLYRAGLIVEPPVFQTNAPHAPMPTELDVHAVHEADQGGQVYAGQAMAVVSTLEDWREIDGLFEEAYGRSFYVRREEAGDWHPSLVLGRPFAAYRLRLTPDEPHSLLTVQVMADKDGKCGACQIVHTLNVMVGFEECLGIPESW